jgi:hypothetical protein
VTEVGGIDVAAVAVGEHRTVREVVREPSGNCPTGRMA